MKTSPKSKWHQTYQQDLMFSLEELPVQHSVLQGFAKGLEKIEETSHLSLLNLLNDCNPHGLYGKMSPVSCQDGTFLGHWGKDLGTFLGALGELRYGFAYRVLNTEHVRTQRFPNAIPQRRRRIFVIGHIGGDLAKSCQGIIKDSAPVREDAPPSRRKREENPKKPTYRSARSDQLVKKTK